MLLLGLILLAAAVAVTVGLYLDNTSPVDGLTAFGQSLGDLTVGELFLAGAVTGLVAAIGLAMMLRGLTRARRKRAERRQLLKRGRTAEELARENERLAAELEQKERTSTSDTAVYPTDSDADRSTETSRHRVWGG